MATGSDAIKTTALVSSVPSPSILAIIQTRSGCSTSLTAVMMEPFVSAARKLCCASPIPTTMRHIGVVLMATSSTDFSRKSGSLMPVKLQAEPIKMPRTIGFLKTRSMGAAAERQLPTLPVRPNSTLAIATVQSSKTLKMMIKEMAGMASLPKLT